MPCGNTCTGTCWQSSGDGSSGDGCNGTCSGRCNTNCTSNSAQGCHCGTDCQGCGAGCANSSTDGGGSSCTCTGTCKDVCKDNCGTECSSSCSVEEASALRDLIESGLRRKILSKDLENIDKMLDIQAKEKRYNKTEEITSVNFDPKIKATSSQIKQLQSNIQTLGLTPEEIINPKIKINQAVGEELIDLTLDLSIAVIKSNKTGD